MDPFVLKRSYLTRFQGSLFLCFILLFIANCCALSNKASSKTNFEYSDAFPKKDATVADVGHDETMGDSVRPKNNTLQLMSVVKLNETTVVGKLRTTVIEWMKKPYVHGIIFPAIVGIACAFVVVVSLLSIRACAKSQARKRRRRRIRNLADELKTDKTMLLAAESSDEDF
ncbi:hypothetical protein TTRE_0000365501 [Trichuris trichiura]|uniref:Transmembrane protein n=1 Tax=Trichuris trichiura TaxID=36087 RepID=A0A077Z6Y0_TRITR|nr:hypothetical protein TTRE_0000365501 [Trichuris trichiura]